MSVNARVKGRKTFKGEGTETGSGAYKEEEGGKKRENSGQWRRVELPPKSSTSREGIPLCESR